VRAECGLSLFIALQYGNYSVTDRSMCQNRLGIAKQRPVPQPVSSQSPYQDCADGFGARINAARKKTRGGEKRWRQKMIRDWFATYKCDSRLAHKTIRSIFVSIALRYSSHASVELIADASLDAAAAAAVSWRQAA